MVPTGRSPDQAGFEPGRRLTMRRAKRLKRGARFATWTIARSAAFIVAVGGGVNAACSGVAWDAGRWS
jgi:hypothetical protein